jgi:hypothetical protein
LSKAQIRERLAQDVGRWLTDGLIDARTAELLRARWQQRSLGLAQVIRALGVAGGLFACFGLFGLIASLSRSQGVGALLALGSGGALLVWGLRLSGDPLGRYPLSCKIILLLGLLAAAAGLGLTLDAAGAGQKSGLLLLGLLVLPLTFGLAYRFDNPFLLLIGLLACFHWVGSWTWMAGRQSYVTEIQDPKLMACVALLACAVGHGQRRWRPHGPASFPLVFEAVGLAYLNLSLLLLSNSGERALQPLWVAALTAAGLLQLLVGARLQRPLYTGFGVTSLVVDLFTRYFEEAWDRLDAGLFFLLGGALLFGTGLLLERVFRDREAASRAAPAAERSP